jgi:hypothetical protein
MDLTNVDKIIVFNLHRKLRCETCKLIHLACCFCLQITAETDS